MAFGDLIGTYGLAGQNGVADNFDAVIRYKSYCAGTRDEEINISFSDKYIIPGGEFNFKLTGPLGSVIDGVLKIPGLPSIKFTSVIKYDSDFNENTVYISGVAGETTGNIILEICSINNYPVKKISDSIIIEDDPYGNSPSPSVYVKLNKYSYLESETVTGSIIVINLSVGVPYTVYFEDENQNNYTLNETLTNEFIATSPVMIFPLTFNKANMPAGVNELIIKPYMQNLVAS